MALAPVIIGGIATLVLAAMAVRLRFGAPRAWRRQQLKWLAYSSLLIPLLVIVCVVATLAGRASDDDAAFTALTFAMLAGIPLSVGIAILR